jgi:hypothetical protein
VQRPTTHCQDYFFFFKTFRLSVSFSYLRERLVNQQWVLMDNAIMSSPEYREANIHVRLNGEVITANLEGGKGLPVDSTTRLFDVRMLLDLHEVATDSVLDDKRFFIAECPVRTLLCLHVNPLHS